MLRGKIRSGKITGSVQNYPALSMVFGEFEVFKSTESEADPNKDVTDIGSPWRVGCARLRFSSIPSLLAVTPHPRPFP